MPGSRAHRRRDATARGPAVGSSGARPHLPHLAAAFVALAALAVTLTHAASNVVRYVYDAAGNIVSIQRVNPAPFAIAGFAPTSGPVGTIVTISGTAFSPIASGNGVTFSAVAASPVSATAATITVAVPSGATSGKIAVTVGGNSAVSAQDFFVAAPGAPTISGFAPAAGSAATSVTVTGTNFNPAAGATTVGLNQNAAAVSSTTATGLAFAVPAATGSGKIRVATSAGTAISATDLIVPPAGTTAGDIVGTARLVANGPAQNIGIFTSNKAGLILFDGNPGDWLTLQLANFALNPAGGAITYSIYKPDNTQLVAGTLSAKNLTIHIPQLSAAGTHAVLLRSGKSQVSLEARLEADRVVPGDGASLVFAQSAGQSARALIAAVAGEQKALMVSALTTVPGATSLGYSIALPGGSTFRNATAFGLGATTQLPPFNATGAHAVVFTPTSATTQTSFKVALLAGIALPVDGAAANLALANPGEGARFNFAGVAGENLGLGLTGLVLNPVSAGNARFSVYKPDAILLAAGNCHADGTQCSVNLPNLPVTGNYSIIVQPANGATGTMQTWLSHDVTGTLSRGTPFGLVLARPGQNGRLTFSGAAGALFAIQVRGVLTAPAGQGILVLVYRPDGAMLASTHLTGAGQTVVMPPLPTTGTYSVVLEPEAPGKGAATAAMEVLLDAGQDLIVDGPTLDSTISVAGASARYTFAGTAGQNLGLGVTNLVLNPTSDASVRVYKPDGTSLTGIGCNRQVGGCGGNLVKLPATGTYSIVVVPASGATGRFRLTLSADLAGTLNVDGASRPISLNRPGLNARLTFAGTAGQALRLGWSGVAIPGTAGNALAAIYRPDGAALGGLQLAHGTAGSYDLPALTATGDYTLFIDPPAGSTLDATLTLSAR